MNNTLVETIEAENDKVVIEIHRDDNPVNPRTEWDNDSEMVMFHSRYNLPNDINYNESDFNSWDEMKERIKNDNDIAEILPIYMYDHSGITIRTTPFECRFDSGQIGFIFITKEQARKSHGVKRLSKKVMATVHNNLLADVKAYDQFIQGEVFGYVIKNKETDEELESCWGFFGMEYCIEEAKAVAKNIIVPPTPEIENPNQLKLDLTM
jgi:hypothetical protein